MIRDQITWKVHADTVANCCRIQLERLDKTPTTHIKDIDQSYKEYENFRDLCKGCVGAEYKMDYEDMIWLGFPYTPGEIKFINNNGTYRELLERRV